MSWNTVKNSFCRPALCLGVLVFVWSCSFHAEPVAINGQVVPVSPAQLSGVSAVKMLPVDEASKDPSFEDFRQRLRQAASRRDAGFILEIIDPEIWLSFGGHRGVKDFTEKWHPEKSDSEFWRELESILALGGTFETIDGQKEFCAPYVTCRWQELVKDFPELGEAHEYTVVLGKNVNVHSKPSADAPILETLSFNVLKLSQVDANERTQWVEIKTPGGHTGYISAKDVRSPLDYRASFKKVKGRWMLVTFIAGD